MRTRLVVGIAALAAVGGVFVASERIGEASPSASSATRPAILPSTSSTATTTLAAITTTGATSFVAPTTTAPATTPSTTSTIPVAQRKTHVLKVTTKPIAATVIVTGPDGQAQTAQSPFTAVVAEGDTTFKITAPGWADQAETISITADTQVTRWLNPPEQLHHKRYETKTGSNPKQVAFTPDSKEMWVTLLGARGLQIFETATGNLATTITLGTKGGAVEVIFTRDGKRAYASQMETATVYEIDTVSKKVLRQFATGGNWTKVLALSSDEATLYAANWVSSDISVIDLRSGMLTKKIPTVKTPRGLSLTPDGLRMYVAGFDGGEIERIDLATDTKTILFRTGGAMRHMAFDVKTNRIFADDMGEATAYVVDLTTEKVSTLAKTDSHPNTIDLSPDGRFLYISNRGENGVTYSVPGPEWGSVLVIDTTTGKAVDAMVGGNQPTGLDVSPDGKLLAFTDFLDNRLTVLDIPSAETLAASKGGFAGPHRAYIAKKTGKKGDRRGRTVAPFSGE